MKREKSIDELMNKHSDLLDDLAHDELSLQNKKRSKM